MHAALEPYLEALFDTDKERALHIIQTLLNQGTPPEDIIFKIVIPGIEHMIGGVASDNLVTLSQHFLASQIAEEVTDQLLPLFKTAPHIRGRIVIGSSFGDFHGLGKKIVGGCLKAGLFEVKDLGINVAPERFVEEALACNAKIIGISAMMVHTATGDHGAKGVRRLLREQQLEERIKIIVGGAPYRFHPQLYREVGADAWADTAAEAPAIVARLLQEMTPC